MRIETQALNFAITPEQIDYVEQRLVLALDSCSKHIGRVEVWLSDLQLSDIDGNRRCLVEVKLGGLAIAFSEGAAPDFHAAVYRAVDEAALKLNPCFGSTQAEPHRVAA